jgi:hypothetical protein
MDSTVSFYLSLSIVFAVIIGIVRYRRINTSYYPFIYNVWLVLIVEIVGRVLWAEGNGSLFTTWLNIFSLLDFFLYTWLFHNWGLFNRRKDVFVGILIFFTIAWAIITLFINPISKPNFYFRILYSFALIFFSVNTFNKVVVHERGSNPFSKWVVAAIWTPIQRFLEVSINTTSDSFDLVDRHNIMMYEWSATQKNLLFISGHTHKPVFASLDHIDRLTKQLEKAIAAHDEAAAKVIAEEIEKRKLEYAGKKFVKTMAHPSYFNSGCCCFSDGDITGIEIADGFIRLIKWETTDEGSIRKVLEESPLYYIFDSLV